MSNVPVLQSEEQPETKWPSVNAAFEFVVPSYQWMLSRFEASDTRIQTMIVFATAVMLGVPALAPAQRINDGIGSSAPFLIACCLFVTLVVIGMLARLRGGIQLVNPMNHYEALHNSEWEFKKNAIFWAGKGFQKNKKAIAQKAHALTLMSVLFFGEGIALFVWLIGE